MESYLPTYINGTHRLVPPQQTLKAITPYLAACGITRCADVTGLDVDLGVCTYCAIRPNALVLQTSSGKGLTPLSAQVSALMEAIELYHAENPVPHRLRRSSLNTLASQGLTADQLASLAAGNKLFFSKDYVIDWVVGEELVSRTAVWVPASAVYFCEQALLKTSTNGLASGNHLIEATLHALYELIERDAISNIDVDGRLKIRENCQIIDIATLTDPTLQAIIRKIQHAQSKLVLLWVPSCIPVHTFWAILLNRTLFSTVSTFNVGYGTHIDSHIAAARAITEAIQSRITLIHGSREDIIDKPVYKADDTKTSPAYIYFDCLEGDTTWQEVTDRVKYRNYDLGQSYTYLLSELVAAGHRQIIRVELTKPDFNIPVVKMIVPSLQFKRKLF